MTDFPERRGFVPPTEADRERRNLATARTLRALLTHDIDAPLTEQERLDYLAGLDDALKPFQPSGAPPVNQEKPT